VFWLTLLEVHRPEELLQCRREDLVYDGQRLAVVPEKVLAAPERTGPPKLLLKELRVALLQHLDLAVELRPLTAEVDPDRSSRIPEILFDLHINGVMLK